MYSKNILLVFTLLMYASSVFVVVMSAFVGGGEDFLKITTKENGFFESIGALLLLIMAIIGFRWLLKHGRLINKLLFLAIGLFSLLCLLAFLEEISWGQHLFHFESSEFFKLNNYQKESNLHNLIPATLFSSIIYFFVYSVFIFIPLFLRFFDGILPKTFPIFRFILPYLPPLHVTLMVLFSSSFQAYFYDDFGVWSDTFSLLCGMALFLFYAIKFKISDKTIWLHLIFVISCIILFMYCHDIFNFFNAQYEIREMFVVLASLIYFKYLLGKFEVNL